MPFSFHPTPKPKVKGRGLLRKLQSLHSQPSHTQIALTPKGKAHLASLFIAGHSISSIARSLDLTREAVEHELLSQSLIRIDNGRRIRVPSNQMAVAENLILEERAKAAGIILAR